MHSFLFKKNAQSGKEFEFKPELEQKWLCKETLKFSTEVGSRSSIEPYLALSSPFELAELKVQFVGHSSRTVDM